MCNLCTDQTQLTKMVADLSMGLSVMKHEQEYMEVRERLHRMSKSVLGVVCTVF